MARRAKPIQDFIDAVNKQHRDGLPIGTKPDVVCEGCGTGYKLHGTHVGGRDKDEAACDVCGTIVYSWNGGNTYTVRRIGPLPSKK